MGNKIAIIALGGNAISKPGEKGGIPEQFKNTRETCEHLIKVMKEGYKICISHGNGPQVGNALRRVEFAEEKNIYPLPLGICVADTEGGMGYMIQQEMRNTMIKKNMPAKNVACIITQVVVPSDDPAFENPTKPVGGFFTEEQAKEIMKVKGWSMVEDAGRGWRRVVPSPKPFKIVESSVIKSLIEQDNIVIACGGGGIPVIEKSGEILDGVDAVVDKDYASSLLAREINADLLLIATGVDKVAINFGKPDQRELDEISVKEARKLYDEGQFPKGSMGPKILASCEFVEKTGKPAIITSLEMISEALNGKSGTKIVP
jgi:carbamate kinase